MSIRMTSARCNNQIISTDNYNPSIHHNLKCEKCNASVSFVHAYYKEINGRRLEVKKHFRLAQNSSHEKDCRYNFERQIKDIFVSIADSGLYSEENGRFIVRLLLREKEMGKITSDTLRNPSASDKSTEPNYISSDTKTAYISCLLKLVKLYHFVEESAEIKKKVLLRVSNRNGELLPVKWEDFCYNENDFPRLYERIHKNGNINHPVFVVGQPILNSMDNRYRLQIEHKETKSDRYSLEFFTNESMYNDLLNSIKKWICVYMPNVAIREPKQWRSLVYYNIDGGYLNGDQVLFF